MKRILLLILLCVLPGAVFGEVFNTATVLKTGRFSLNFEEQYDFGSKDSMFLFHFGTGIINNTSDMAITLGFPSGGGDRYVGIDVEFVISRTRPASSISFGVHREKDFGLDTTLLMSGNYGDIRPFMGFDIDHNFTDTGDFYKVNFVIGSEMRFRHNVGVIIEGGIEISSNYDLSTSYFSGGIVVYF